MRIAAGHEEKNSGEKFIKQSFKSIANLKDSPSSFGLFWRFFST